ncbi:MAG: lipoprotein [Rhodoferax sp.]|nr:lipoprotein [Rhodoferax sp.]
MIHEFGVGHYNFTMLLSRRILVSAIILGISAVSLSACGQQGALYLPTEPAAAKRATLPETLSPFGPAKTTQPDAQTVPSSAKPPASAPTPAPQ